MADRITDERLRQMAAGWYCGMAEYMATAAELLAARAEVERLRAVAENARRAGQEWTAGQHELVAELRAEVERLREQLRGDDGRAWEALGKPEGAYATTHVQRLCAEVKRLKSEYDGVPTYNAVCQQMHETEQELDSARAEVERLREALTDMLEDVLYIQVHGDLYGGGWDRAEKKARKALERHKETNQ